MSKNWEMRMAELFESRLKKEVFNDAEHVIRRDHQLKSSNKGENDVHRIPLYFDKGETRRASNVANVDAIVLTRNKNPSESGWVELVIEYECDINPKNLLGNLVAPSIADYHLDIYDGETKYDIVRDCTRIIVIACLEARRKSDDSGQAPLRKGDELSSRVSQFHSSTGFLLEGACITGDDIDKVIDRAIDQVNGWRSSTN